MQKKLAFAAGECVYTSERFWNKVGWKRVYGRKNHDNKEVSELEYYQPPLDFEKSGKVAKGAGSAPEHLMIDSFGQQPPGKEGLKQTVDAMYRWMGEWWPEKAFTDKEAFGKQRNSIYNLRRDFYKQVDSYKDFLYLTVDFRSKAKEKNIKVDEFTEANNGNTGDEDF
jgi:hypothetical protein